MFCENEDSIMKAPEICSDRSSRWHLSAPSTRVKKSRSHIKRLRWLLTQLLVFLLVAGQASCNQSSTTPAVNYFLDVSVSVNVEKDEAEITAWLKEVFQNNLQSCVSSATAVPAFTQTTAATSTTFTSSRATTTANSTVQDTSTSTHATSTAATSGSPTSTTATSTATKSTAITSTTTTSTAITSTATTSTAITSTATTSTTATSTATKSTAITSTTTTSTAITSTATTSTTATSTATKSTAITSTASTSTSSKSTAATSTAATSTATKSTAATSTAATSTAATSTATKSTAATSKATTSTVATSTAVPSTSRKSAATSTSTTQELKSSSTTLAATSTALKVTSTTKAATTQLKTTKAAKPPTTTPKPTREKTPTPTTKPAGEVIQQTIIQADSQTSFVEVTAVPDENGNNGKKTNAPNTRQLVRRRVAREVNNGAAQISDDQTNGILQAITASCSEKTAIRNTNCSVTLSMNQRVPPCCILRTLCEASKASPVFNAVGRRVDIINPLQNECNSDPPKENSCIYKGEVSQSCDTSAFIASQGDTTQCNTGKTCGCSSYCSGTNAYYAFEISIQDSKISFAQVSSLISTLEETPECSTSTDALCPSPSIAAQYEGFSLSCGSTTTNLGNCRVVLNFTSAIAICEVAKAVSYVLQVGKQISFTRPVTFAAICGNSEVSLQQTVFTWKLLSLKPAEFCPALEGTSGFECKNGETLLILLNQQCDLQSTTVAPNVTTIQPNTTLTVTVTTTPLYMTTNVTVTPNTTTANVTVTPDTTTANVTVTPDTTTANVTVPLNTTTTNVTVPPDTMTTTANAESQANALLELTKDVSKLNSSQISQLVSQLERLLSGPNVSLALGNTSVQIVSNLLGASPEVLSDSSNRIIGLVDTVGLKLVLGEAEETLLSPDVALSVKPADGTNFQETVFSILSPSDVQLRGGSRRSRSVRADSSIPQGSIKLPPSLTQNLSTEQQQLASRVQFNFYQKSTVFQDQSLGQRRLISGILGASVANLSISNLQDNVVINLRNTEPIPANFVATCVFWDFTLNGGSGGWNPNGCSVQNSTDNETVCGCNHLTSFAILLDLSREPLTSRVQATILTFITYIGCGISAIFLAITLLTYLAFGKLRKDIPSKILIQLCLALLLLNLVFLVDAWLALYPDAVGLCISTAWFLHYFLLVSFTWMGLEAVHMYIALVKVFNSYISRYMLKFSLVGWGVPMIVVIIVIAIDKDNYGLISYGRFTDGTSDDFCWIKNDIAFYVAVVAYFCVIFLFNLVMFVVVLVQLCRIKRQNPHNSNHRTTLQDVRSVVGITILLGLTWGFAFFAWGPVNLAFMYLFAIFNSLHGFFIFVFHCAVKENVRRQWRTYLCCGKMRLAENSDWSRTATQKTMKKSSVTRLTPERSSKQSNNSSSSSFLVSDSSEHLNGISSPFEDRTITADEEPSRDVIFNEINRQRRSHQAS